MARKSRCEPLQGSTAALCIFLQVSDVFGRGDGSNGLQALFAGGGGDQALEDFGYGQNIVDIANPAAAEDEAVLHIALLGVDQGVIDAVGLAPIAVQAVLEAVGAADAV